ncbi:MAG TPA: monofunctional biosynthetic peptidoglycan transglycosylase [Chthoniobacterales bacterium]
MSGRNSLKPARSRHWLRWILLGLVVLLLLPVAEVAAVKFINPPITPEMVRFKLCPGDQAARARGLRYEWIPLQEVPLAQIRFLWASEDQRFFEHNGFDFDEIHQAIRESEKSGHKPRGGSTISQQCARSLFLWQGRSWLRKGLETYYTFLMEHILSKRRILELYVNVIEFGDGIYGVKAAAETYYGEPPSRLTETQMALLAAVLPNPKHWSPVRPSERVIQRLHRVLRLERAAAFPVSKLR